MFIKAINQLYYKYEINIPYTPHLWAFKETGWM